MATLTTDRRERDGRRLTADVALEVPLEAEAHRRVRLQAVRPVGFGSPVEGEPRREILEDVAHGAARQEASRLTGVAIGGRKRDRRDFAERSERFRTRSPEPDRRRVVPVDCRVSQAESDTTAPVIGVVLDRNPDRSVAATTEPRPGPLEDVPVDLQVERSGLEIDSGPLGIAQELLRGDSSSDSGRSGSAERGKKSPAGNDSPVSGPVGSSIGGPVGSPIVGSVGIGI